MVNPRRRPRRSSTLEGNVHTSAQPAAGERKKSGGGGGGFVSSKGSPFMVSGELFLRSTRELLFSDLSGGSSGGGSSIPQRQQQQQQRPAASHSNSRRANASTSTRTLSNNPSQTAATTTAAARAIAAATSTTATAAANAATDHPSAGLLAGLSGNLRSLLLCHPDLETHDDTGNGYPFVVGGGEGGVPPSPAAATEEDRSSPGLRVLVSSARRERRSARLERIEHLKASRTIARCMATTRLIAVQKAVAEFKGGCDDGRARLDTRLGSLVLRFAAVASAEMAQEDAQTAAEAAHCRRETERLELAARLASLAAIAEHRTRGSVVLRRLPPSHPQHARCLRAATQNVKPEFFSSESPYGAVRVLDIYKIENKFLLDRFQRAGKEKDSCKVKGLFCHVPDESLEHIVLYGMGTGMPGGGGGGPVCTDTATQGYDWDGDPIDLIWADKGAGLRELAARGGAGLSRHTIAANRGMATADGGVTHAKPLVFPRAFSRYGTLEEEREYANRAEAESGGAAGLLSSPVAMAAAPRPNFRPGQRRASDEGRRHEAGAVSGLRLLALCRVMIGSMCVSPSPSASRRAGVGDPQSAENARGALSCAAEGAAFPCPPLPSPPPGQAEFDSVYFPREEEYLLLNEAFVLPEFLVVHRFADAGAQNAPSSAAWTKSVSSSGSAEAAVATATAATPAAAAGAESGTGISGGGGGGTVARERADSRRREERGGHNPLHAATPPAAPVAQSAASVVAGIEAAMRPARPSLTLARYPATPTIASDEMSARTSPGEMAGADSVPTMSGSDGGLIAGNDNRRRRQRGSGKASIDPIVRSVELEFARYWQEVDLLRRVEKKKVSKSAGKSKTPKQPP